MKESPSISVIVATYNSSDTLQYLFNSFRSQESENFDLIIIDGGSADGTVDIIKKNERMIRTWISEPDSGIYEAWNKGLSLVRSEWVCFLGSDDFLLNSKSILYLQNAVKDNNEAPFIWGNVNVYSNKMKMIRKWGISWTKPKTFFLEGL